MAYEPGMLRIFRIFLLVQVVLLALGWVAVLLDPDNNTITVFTLGILMETVLLLVLLFIPGLQRGLRMVYFPLAVGIAAVGPLLSHHVFVLAQALAETPAPTNHDPSILVLYLIVPLMLVCYQYRFRGMWLFVLLSTAVDLTLAVVGMALGGLAVAGYVEIWLIRALFFIAVGYVVSLLSKAQHNQRVELAEKNQQLHAYAATLEQLTVSRERNRMARELHDTLAHTLTAVGIQLQAVEISIDKDPTQAQQFLAEAQKLNQQGAAEVRRTLNALRASPLEDLGLALAIGELARSSAARAELALVLTLPEAPVHLNPAREQHLYRIAEEAISNVLRHADAGELAVHLVVKRDRFTLTIQDDGIGFDPAQPVPGRYGVLGMQERAQLADCELYLVSHPGKGTAVTVTGGLV